MRVLETKLLNSCLSLQLRILSRTLRGLEEFGASQSQPERVLQEAAKGHGRGQAGQGQLLDHWRELGSSLRGRGQPEAPAAWLSLQDQGEAICRPCQWILRQRLWRCGNGKLHRFHNNLRSYNIYSTSLFAHQDNGNYYASPAFASYDYSAAGASGVSPAGGQGFADPWNAHAAHSGSSSVGVGMGVGPLPQYTNISCLAAGGNLNGSATTPPLAHSALGMAPSASSSSSPLGAAATLQSDYAPTASLVAAGYSYATSAGSLDNGKWAAPESDEGWATQREIVGGVYT